MFSVAPNGALTNAANVADNPTRQLGGVSALTTAVIGGTTYLFAAGAQDNGVSVFSLDSTGALTDVTSVSDNATLQLLGTDAVTTAVVGNTTYLFAAGKQDNGVSVFSLRPTVR